MTRIGSQGVRGRRKSTYVAGAVVLLVMAAALAIAGSATDGGAMLWVALVLGAVALLLILVGRRVRRTPPSHPNHPRLTHDEDHPKDPL